MHYWTLIALCVMLVGCSLAAEDVLYEFHRMATKSQHLLKAAEESEGSCTKLSPLQCLPAGGSCSIAYCANCGTYCNPGLTCINGTCATNSPNGALCGSVGGSCFSQLYQLPSVCNYTSERSGYCAQTRNSRFGPGDNCLASTDCTSPSCVNGKCVGLTPGANCVIYFAGCSYGFICAFQNMTSPSPTCLPAVPQGGVCSVSGDCQLGLVCNNLQCVPQYSVTTGPCSLDSACAEGLRCVNQQCIGPSNPGIGCTLDTDCAAGMSCTCNPATGNNVCMAMAFNYCTQEYKAYTSCLINNQCAVSGVWPGTCVYNQCLSSYNQYIRCYTLKSFPGFIFNYTGCNLNLYGPASVKAVDVILVLLSLLTVVFFS